MDALSHVHFSARTEKMIGMDVSCDRAREFEITFTLVVNGYINGPSLRLRINLKWPECMFLLQKKSGLWGRD